MAVRINVGITVQLAIEEEVVAVLPQASRPRSVLVTVLVETTYDAQSVHALVLRPTGSAETATTIRAAFALIWTKWNANAKTSEAGVEAFPAGRSILHRDAAFGR